MDAVQPLRSIDPYDLMIEEKEKRKARLIEEKEKNPFSSWKGAYGSQTIMPLKDISRSPYLLLLTLVIAFDAAPENRTPWTLIYPRKGTSESQTIMPPGSIGWETGSIGKI